MRGDDVNRLDGSEWYLYGLIGGNDVNIRSENKVMRLAAYLTI
jgi:hypothetical protein